MVCAAAFGFAQLASAQTVINITGATAFRSSVHTTLVNILDSGTRTYGYVGTNGLGNAGQAIFKGNLGGPTGPLVTIRTSFSGSATGIAAVTSGSNVNFLATGSTTSAGGTSGLANGTDPAVADFALSDVFQNSTNFKSPALTTSIVAVVPFVFMGSKNLPSGVTTMNPNIFRSMWANGAAPLAMFTGLAADEDKFVHPVGRDAGSGTRITTLAETGYGINIPVNQFNLTITTTAPFDVTAQVTADDPSIDGEDGNFGASSGGTVASWLNATTTAVSAANGYTTYYMSYLGVTDATTAYAAGAGAKYIAWNGVNYFNGTGSYLPDLIYNGKYTFWGYEHFYYLPATNAGVKGTFITNFQAALAANPGAAGLNPANMRVSRQNDGGLIAPTYL